MDRNKCLTVLWLIPLLFMFGFMFGCADSSQTGLDKKTEVLIKIKVVQEAGNQGNVHISPTGELKSIMGDTDQESAAVAEAQAQFKIPVAQQGGQANIESDTVDAAAKQDNRKTDSDNPVNSTETNSSNYPVAPKTAVPEIPVIETDLPAVTWGEMPYSHTQTNGTDGGQSLVMLLDTKAVFEKCYAGSVDIPYHGLDEGRISYWNKSKFSNEDIICELARVKYKFPTGKGILKAIAKG